MTKKLEFWERAAPKDAAHKHLSTKQVTAAKARARANGRPYPNLVDNAAIARSSHAKSGK